jgi:phosphinothricin acetyltransferase
MARAFHTIRHATVDDVPALAAIYNEAVLTTTATFDIEPKSLADRTTWLQSRGDRYPVLVAEIEGEVVGYAALARWSERAAYDDTAETALYVHSAHRDRGVGRELNAAIFREARRLGFHSLIARITADSAASLHLHQSAGFVAVGTLREVGRKFGRLLDVQVLQLVFDEARLPRV